MLDDKVVGAFTPKKVTAPVLVFTSEEVWATRFPDAGSVHLVEWPMVETVAVDAGYWERWSVIRDHRKSISEMVEPLRREKVIGSSLEAAIIYPGSAAIAGELVELAIVATVADGSFAKAAKTDFHKCGRCWRHLPEVTEDGDLCARCDEVVHAR